MGREIPRVVLVLGAVLAVVGLTLYAIGQATRAPSDLETNWGLILLIGGIVAAILGFLVGRVTGALEPEVTDPAYLGEPDRGAGRSR